MKNMLLLTATLFAAILLNGCEKENGEGRKAVSPQAEEALLALYPEATNIRWQHKQGYVVAKFDLPAGRAAAVGQHTAWFDNGGSWYMTQTGIAFAALPEAVQTAFRTSEYAAWVVDDADKLERQGAETVYVIEAEGRIEGVETEIDLYYSPEGVLVRKIVDADDDYDYGDYIPSQLTGGIEAFIRANYPAARILDVDSEDGATEVEMLDGDVCRELLFDRSGAWIHTKTEMRRGDLPEAVLQALAASAYASYRIDDIDHYRLADGEEYYRLELESAAGDAKVDITPDGVLTVVSLETETGGGAVVDEAIRKFIAEKYPNAVVRDAEYDDGLLEVEIRHDGKEKEVYFNGAKAWVRTEWDIRRSELPAAVIAAIAASQYAAYAIEDITYVETPDGACYRIELEQGDREVKIRMDASGRIL